MRRWWTAGPGGGRNATVGEGGEDGIVVASVMIYCGSNGRIGDSRRPGRFYCDECEVQAICQWKEGTSHNLSE